MLDLTTADKVLKVFYLPPMSEMLNSSTILLSRLDRDEQVGGKTFTIPLHLGANEAAGVGRDVGGTLPTAGNQAYGEAIVPNKYIYGRIQIAGPVIQATRQSSMAFIKAIESEVKGCLKNTKRAVNRQLHSDGLDALGYFVSRTSATESIFDDNLVNAFVHIPTVAISGDLLDASAAYAVIHQGTYKDKGTSGATGVDVTTTEDLAAGTAAADGDPLVVTGTKGFQMMGIAGIVDDANPILLAGGLHGITVASQPLWKAQVVGSDASKVDLSFANMQKLLSKIATNSDATEADVKFGICSYGVRDKYVELCVNERRFYNTMTLDGGFEAVSFNNKPIVPDAQCRKNRLYFIVPDTMAIFRSSDFSWMDRDGAVLHRVAGVDAYEGILFHYGDLGCRTRNQNGVLKGINE